MGFWFGVLGEEVGEGEKGRGERGLLMGCEAMVVGTGVMGGEKGGDWVKRRADE